MRWFDVDDEKHKPPFAVHLLVFSGSMLDPTYEVVTRVEDYNGHMSFEDKNGYLIDYTPTYWSLINTPYAI